MTGGRRARRFRSQDSFSASTGSERTCVPFRREASRFAFWTHCRCYITQREETMRLIVFAVALVLPGAGQAVDVTSRIIEGEVYYRQPMARCEVPQAVMRIARAGQIPAGIERLPDDCLASSSRTTLEPDREKVYLAGKRVGDALNELVAADPRYAWMDSDGVIVIRPLTAWANRQHFLHRTIRSFTVVEQHVGVALDEWRRAVRGETALPLESHSLRAAQRTAEGNRPFTVTLGDAPTAISALEQIARAHGRLVWEVEYCQPFAESRFATVSLWTTEQDPTGIGLPMPGRFPAINGKTVDACAGKM